MGNLFAVEAARKAGADPHNMALSGENRKGGAVPARAEEGWRAIYRAAISLLRAQLRPSSDRATPARGLFDEPCGEFRP
jgi:hypothetical protein